MPLMAITERPTKGPSMGLRTRKIRILIPALNPTPPHFTNHRKNNCRGSINKTERIRLIPDLAEMRVSEDGLVNIGEALRRQRSLRTIISRAVDGEVC